MIKSITKWKVNGPLVRRTLLYLSGSNVSVTFIAKSCNISNNTVRKIKAMAKEYSFVLSPSAIDRFTDEELGNMYRQMTTKKQEYEEPDWVGVEVRHEIKHESLRSIYAEYLHSRAGKCYCFSTFCLKYQEYLKGKSGLSMPIPRVEGDEIQVDWCDHTYPVFDDEGNEATAYVFVGVLSFSCYMYAEAVLVKNIESYINCQVNMFSHFCGSARMLVCDNWSPAVKYDGQTAVINPSYLLLARHFRTRIIPARIRAPKDKTIAENSVGMLEKVLDAEPRGRIDYNEFCELVIEKTKEINDRHFAKRAFSRSYLFDKYEVKALTELKLGAKYKYVKAERVTAGDNYCISWAGNLYSVPHQYIGEELIAFEEGDSTVMIVDVELNYVASHRRFTEDGLGRKSLQTDHMPPKHLAEIERRIREGYRIIVDRE